MAIPNIHLRELTDIGQVGVLGVNDPASPDSELCSVQTPGPTGINDLHDPTRNKGATLLMFHPTITAKKIKQTKIKLIRLKTPVLPLVCAPDMLPAPEAHPAMLNDSDYKAAAESLKCEVAAIKAVAAVESAGGGFLSDGRPKILFEAHIFGKLTFHIFDTDYPSVSALNWAAARKFYLGGEAEYLRLELAYPLNPDAALSAASWGKFQIMGFNCKTAGFDNVQAFVRAMYESERRHLDAFVSFLRTSGLDRQIRDKAWDKFALGYNGNAYKKNDYDVKLSTAYDRFSAEMAAGSKK